jgi:hypothetical protein
MLLYKLSPGNVPSVFAAGESSEQVLGASTNSVDPLLLPQIIGSFSTTDARVHIIKDYLKKYSSPLLPFAQDLVDISDKYLLDYRLLVAIARQESNICKRIPPDSHNCWGFGIYGDKVTRFDSYPEAMETVAKTLKLKYIDQGLDTPEKIMAKYTPPSLLIGGPWAKGVSQFMLDME